MTGGRPLRTVHVDTERTWGGGQRQVAWLVAGLAARGHPTWLLARRGSRFPEVLAGSDVPVRRFDPLFEWDVAAAVRVRRFAERVGADLVVAHAAHASALAALASLGSGPPYVVTRRVALPVRAVGPSGWKYRRAAQVIAVSERVRGVLAASGLPVARLTVVRSGIDLWRAASPAAPAAFADLGLDPARPVAVMVSALVAPHKDPVTFVRAIAEARRARPDLQGLLVGGGPLLPEVVALARELAPDGSVRVAGDRLDAERLLAAGTVAVLTSRDEGLGTTLLDAMLWGVPIVATRAGGVAEIVRDGIDGLLAPVGDAAAVAAHVVRVLGDPALRGRLVAQARMRVDAFSVEAMVEGTIDAYRCALYSAPC